MCLWRVSHDGLLKETGGLCIGVLSEGEVEIYREDGCSRVCVAPGRGGGVRWFDGERRFEERVYNRV